ncbi:MAG: VWA domain-containing protein [Phycisphaerae bacterium]|nr:VWA domain-containing protein [Phycisphaerae bacterium]
MIVRRLPPKASKLSDSAKPVVISIDEQHGTIQLRGPDKPVGGLQDSILWSQARSSRSGTGGHEGPQRHGGRRSGIGRQLCDEELWVIAKPDTTAKVDKPEPAPDDTPGTGALMAKPPGQKKEVPVPLKHTDVKAAVSGYIATVDVTQQYHNPYDEKIEAVYLFPLPQNAAVNEFVMTVGDRRIRGIIRERQEAEKIYAEAKQQGYVASLLTQERPNVFTQSVANIEPGKAIDIQITYFHTLAYDDGWYEYVFPMVVGPRYNPSGSTDGIGAVARGKHGASGQKTEVQYLRPDERSGHDVALTVDLDAGVKIESVECRSHAIDRSRLSDTRMQISLARLDRIPNKDFVLRYKVGGDAVKTGLITQVDQRGGFFTLMLYPPADMRSLQRKPLELVFVLDCSGSMSGQPIAQAKSAVQRALTSMRPDDTFQVIRFSNNASTFGANPVPATPDNVRRAQDYVRGLRGSGGTQMIQGIRAALDFPHDPKRLRFVVFLTDGFIGNEMDILAAVHDKIRDSRIFSFGVGSSTNRYLLDRMAKLGKGAVAYLGLNDSGADVMDRFFERVAHPAITDLSVDWSDLRVTDVYPDRLPDLFVGRPVVVTGRFDKPAPTAIRVRGKVGDHECELTIPATFDAADRHKGLPAIWARMKIADLYDRTPFDRSNELVGQIKQVALSYGLMSAYTAFVAVDSLTRTAGTQGTTVAVPVPVPDGVKYKTTVSE